MILIGWKLVTGKRHYPRKKMASVSQTQILHFYSIQNEISTFHVEMIFILILNTAQLRTCSGTQVGLKKH